MAKRIIIDGEEYTFSKGLKEIERSTKLKGRFSQKWLAASNEYYQPLFERLFNVLWLYFNVKGAKSESKKLAEIVLSTESLHSEEAITLLDSLDNENRAFTLASLGIPEFHFLQLSIDSLNRGFITLLNADEPLAAMALIRLQLDNLTYLLAEIKHPFRVFYKVYFAGKQLNDIKIANKNIVPSAIRKEFDSERHYKLEELYTKYSCFVHPHQQQKNMLPYQKHEDISYKKLTKKAIKELAKDMILVNQYISHCLICQVAGFNIKVLHSKVQKQQNPA